MKAICPKDPTHKKFVTIAHVAEDWLVDEHGNWLSTLGSVETTHKPDPDNDWTCDECGAKATVTR
jgi:hypothetical protein